jgi:2-dehydro-3-deoxygluconokinase
VLGEVMLRLDPALDPWGGEHNVARALRKCFSKRATVVTALPQNDFGCRWKISSSMASTRPT